ncbi:hypothetical protein HYW87_01810 [Candidatus Roizmanbacteria bacterium]|nr:hypothetical protein [Candidatus Roizmanbacteria bacterium]
MVLPIISAVANAVGAAAGAGAEAAAAGGFLPAAGGATAAVETGVGIAARIGPEVVTKLPNPVAANAVEGTLTNVVKSSANGLKGVEAVAAMSRPLEVVKTAPKSPISAPEKSVLSPQAEAVLSGHSGGAKETTKQELPKSQEVIDAEYKADWDRLQYLRQVRTDADLEIKALEAKLKLAKGVSPWLIAAFLAVGTGTAVIKQVEQDQKEE